MRVNGRQYRQSVVAVAGALVVVVTLAVSFNFAANAAWRLIGRATSPAPRFVTVQSECEEAIWVSVVEEWHGETGVLQWSEVEAGSDRIIRAGRAPSGPADGANLYITGDQTLTKSSSESANWNLWEADSVLSRVPLFYSSGDAEVVGKLNAVVVDVETCGLALSHAPARSGDPQSAMESRCDDIRTGVASEFDAAVDVAGSETWVDRKRLVPIVCAVEGNNLAYAESWIGSGGSLPEASDEFWGLPFVLLVSDVLIERIEQQNPGWIADREMMVQLLIREGMDPCGPVSGAGDTNFVDVAFDSRKYVSAHIVGEMFVRNGGDCIR